MKKKIKRFCEQRGFKRRRPTQLIPEQVDMFPQTPASHHDLRGLTASTPDLTHVAQ